MQTEARRFSSVKDNAAKQPLDFLVSTGAICVITAMVLSEFFDITLFNAGGVVVSAQKLIALALLPLGLLLMGRLHAPKALLVSGGLFAIAGSVGPWIEPASTGAIGVVSVALLNVLAACILVTALSAHPQGIRIFIRLWIAASVLTALVAVGQTLGVFPLITVPQEYQYLRQTSVGLTRGTGFKFDPNFCALLLVAGLAFALTSVRRLRWRLILGAVILAGIVATLSRMGVICALLAIVLLSPSGDRPRPFRRIGRTVIVGSLSALVIWAILAFLSAPLRAYVQLRLQDLGGIFSGISGGEAYAFQGGSSAAERVDLFRGGLEVAGAHWFAGVGAGQVPEAMYNAVGIDKAVHNTYLETLCMGGIFGLAFLIYYGFSTLRPLVRRVKLADSGGLRAPILAFCILSFAMALVLTLDYNAFLWLPLGLATSLEAKYRLEGCPGFDNGRE